MILGVVRARVDFDERSKRDDDAIAALTEAARKARTDLSGQFRFEAARIATNAGRIDEARTLLTDLLNAEPNRADYLAQMAETYAAANDDKGFIEFASTRIEALKKASLQAEDRKSLIASLRRRLIVTLTRRNDYAPAVDQYIEVVNAYPEDEGVVREAALFASAHNRKGQLVSFYRKTIADAPRDWRWPMVLARVETAMEDYPAALNAWDTAMKARPDRADLVQARASLEERLLRFDDAIASYTKLYQLTYNDAEWLDKAAEMQARLGRGAEAVATLERAHIGAGGETVTGLFRIAAVLDQCHLESDAARYAERGYRLAGNDIAKYPAQLETYGRIMAEMRRNDVIPGLGDGRSAGRLITELYTPEDKVDLSGRPGMTSALAEAAGLEDDLALKLATASRQAWISLQSRRGLYEQLSRDLEALANQQGETNIGDLLSQAVAAASKAGDSAARIRIYARMQSAGLLSMQQLDRYLELLLAQNPSALIAQRSDQAVQVAIATGNQAVAMDALRARSASLPPVWLNSYTALTGVYFDDRSPAVNQAFLTVLHPQTIGERLASRPDVSRSLVGSVWFYYGARFGEYLAHVGSSEADDYLSSDPESRPGDPEVYISQGRFYAELRRFPGAIAQFRKALELDPDRGEAHDGIARALIQQGRQAEAIAEWREALGAFQREQSKGVRVRESFWTNVSAAIRSIASAKVFAEVQPDIHALLADYVHRNGAYRINELVEPVLNASFQSNIGFDWLLDIMAQTGGANLFPQPDATPDELERLDRFQVAYLLREAALATGFDKTRYEEQAISARASLIRLLLTNGKVDNARNEWQQFSAAELRAHGSELTDVEIQFAAAAGTFDQLLSHFRSEPAKAPSMDELLKDATILRQEGHVPAALSLLEFVYTRELDQQHLEIANFLGLARGHLERGNELPQALAVLRRMTLVANPPFGESWFEAFEPAGDLLIEFHHEAEAKEFFSKAVQATPWNAQAKIKLARTSNPAERTRLAKEVVNDSTARYATRADAARMLAPTQIALTGELALLASGDKSPGPARKPFFLESRLDAAAGVSDPALKLGLLREALAIAPDDPRVRLAAVRAALGAGNDRLALAMYQASAGVPVFGYQPTIDDQQPSDEQQQPYETPRHRIVPDTSLLEALSAAAERTGDLAAALGYVRQAQPQNRQRIAALQAEEKRRQDNSKRQPIVSGKTEKTQIVRARELP
jgi:tetratricopeptide (TPR) repeat protein